MIPEPLRSWLPFFHRYWECLEVFDLGNWTNWIWVRGNEALKLKKPSEKPPE